MYAIGHFALGYLTGKPASKLLKVNLNMPLLLLASIIPDIDLVLKGLLPNLFIHRVETHSIITFTIVMIPFFIIYRKQALPYYVVLLSHSLLGDLFTGGVGLFWPLTNNVYGVSALQVTSAFSVVTELILFTVSLPIMIYEKDLQSLWKETKYKVVLVVPFVALIGPLLQYGRHLPGEGSIPFLLIFPSVFWIAILSYSILMQIAKVLKSQ
jgi:membrane-bound metal-dependent hydrolase YbcI (DUF457 family)